MKLVGKLGEIHVSEGNSGDCVAVISSGILREKYGDSVQFQVDDLAKWIKRLKIESTADGRIRIGNWGE